jgi:hypothetical protein
MRAKQNLGLVIFAVGGTLGCGTYNQLTPGAQAVRVATSRPQGNCQSLGTVTGKGGGSTGGYVSNEKLIEYALNDARNQAAALGATDVVYSGPALGGNEGTTTSAMVTGEALKCEGGTGRELAIAAAPAPTAATTPPATAAPQADGGCRYDTQCKGDRICVQGACVEPSKTSTAPVAPPPSSAPTP